MATYFINLFSVLFKLKILMNLFKIYKIFIKLYEDIPLHVVNKAGKNKFKVQIFLSSTSQAIKQNLI